MAHRQWWDYRQCDRRSEENRKFWPLEYAARALARRSVSPRKWSIQDCPVREWKWQDGVPETKPVIRVCRDFVHVRLPEDADHAGAEAFAAYRRRNHWHQGYQAFICDNHWTHFPHNDNHPTVTSYRGIEFYWQRELELRQMEAETQAVLSALGADYCPDEDEED